MVQGPDRSLRRRREAQSGQRVQTLHKKWLIAGQLDLVVMAVLCPQLIVYDSVKLNRYHAVDTTPKTVSPAHNPKSESSAQ
jgi:hypothetical protein